MIDVCCVRALHFGPRTERECPRPCAMARGRARTGGIVVPYVATSELDKCEMDMAPRMEYSDRGQQNRP